MTPDVQAVFDVLSDSSNAVDPKCFPADLQLAQRPGMYAWWGDAEACTVLGAELGVELPSLLYVGQAGATKWPSGKRSTATLATRIGRQHIRGNARSSTFRRTISALLLDQLQLVPAGGGRLDSPSNAVVSQWIAEHLTVGIVAVDDRDALGRVEQALLDQLDPPLNLDHCPSSAARARLTALRARISR
ncbi:GIY-YIG nuclease family protein [Mycobacterium adipatum]|uniref:GIY-YIG nuclease family protein n=1 Tax=Mycobacterium adipatum TaxID=1682113 RepID=UPI0012E8B1C3|nr:hypothetical protein [Mycobacterium adipatum]